MQNIISVEFLSELDPKSYCIVDCRFSLLNAEYGQLAYSEDHIPNAIYANLNEDLSGEIKKGTTGRHPLPAPEDFEIKIQQWGINNGQLVVLYDDDVGSYAARAWWMFRWLGHEQVTVLRGGYKAWKKAGYATNSDLPTFEPSEFKRQTCLTKEISANELIDYPHSIIDARDPKRFAGEIEPIDAIAGHIPRAQCMPFMQNVNEEGEIKTSIALREQYEAFGIVDKDEIVCYCGSGVTAAHNILCLVDAGFPEPILYAGSWSEWITNPDREVALGN
jgi:thiosulfate/3-mercaptopyruvate sulfurtransferase